MLHDAITTNHWNFQKIIKKILIEPLIAFQTTLGSFLSTIFQILALKLWNSTVFLQFEAAGFDSASLYFPLLFCSHSALQVPAPAITKSNC